LAAQTPGLVGSCAKKLRPLVPALPRLGREGCSSPVASPRNGSGGKSREQGWACGHHTGATAPIQPERNFC